jgi:hypothetical protein
MVPNSALSANTGKLDIDSVYGVADFADLTGISAPWFEQQNGAYTGRFAQVHVQAPHSATVQLSAESGRSQISCTGVCSRPQNVYSYTRRTDLFGAPGLSLPVKDGRRPLPVVTALK